MKVTIDLKAGPDGRDDVRPQDIQANIDALERVIDGKPLSCDFVLLHDTKSILEGIKKELDHSFKKSPEEVLEQIRRYQKRMDVHPLTCGNDSRHEVLDPFVEGDKIKLRCLDCDYIQDSYPVCILEI